MDNIRIRLLELDVDTLNQDQLIKLVSEKSGLSQVIVKKVLQALVSIVVLALSEKITVTLTGLGRWHVAKYRSHYGKHKNRSTVVRGHLRVRWRSGSKLKRSLNPHLYNSRETITPIEPPSEAPR